jgi:hypothetical protein
LTLPDAYCRSSVLEYFFPSLRCFQSYTLCFDSPCSSFLRFFCFFSLTPEHKSLSLSLSASLVTPHYDSNAVLIPSSLGMITFSTDPNTSEAVRRMIYRCNTTDSPSRKPRPSLSSTVLVHHDHVTEANSRRCINSTREYRSISVPVYVCSLILCSIDNVKHIVVLKISRTDRSPYLLTAHIRLSSTSVITGSLHKSDSLSYSTVHCACTIQIAT